MRSSMTQTNCTCWMSLVVRVMRDAVEKFSISALEKPMTLAEGLTAQVAANGGGHTGGQEAHRNGHSHHQQSQAQHLAAYAV